MTRGEETPPRRLKADAQKKSDTHTDSSRVALEEKVKALEAALLTQRKEMEKVSRSLLRLRLRDRFLERVTHLIAHPDRMLDNLQSILDMSMEAIPAEAGSILLLDAANQELYFSVASGPVARGIKDFRLQVGEGIAGACLQGKEVIAVSDVEKDPRFHKAMSRALGFKTRSLLAVPVVHLGNGLGVLEIVNREGGDHFTAEEIETIQLLARVAGGLLSIWAGG
jgi:signal transduction protein with GAF and PtsI domain